MITPGIYKTRDGHEVEVFRVKQEYSANGYPYTFPVKGHILRKTRTGKTRRQYDVWKLDGSFRAVGENPLDLIIEQEN